MAESRIPVGLEICEFSPDYKTSGMMAHVTFRVMTVCTGNICRSPMAAIMLAKAFEDAGIGGQVVVDSTGVSSEENGNPVDPRAKRVLAAHGYDDGGEHRARQVAAHELAQRDLVLPMTAAHERVLRRLAERCDAPTDHIRLWRSFDPAVTGRDGARLDVEDPWYGGPQDFEVCLAELAAAIPGILAHVQARLP